MTLTFCRSEWRRLTELFRRSRLGRRMDEKVTKRRHAISHFESYEVFEHELTLLETGQSSHQNDLTFFSVAVAVFVSFLSVWLTLPNGGAAGAASAAPLTRAEQFYFLVVLASGGLSAFFFYRWWQSSKTAFNVCQIVRQRAANAIAACLDGQEG